MLRTALAVGLGSFLDRSFALGRNLLFLLLTFALGPGCHPVATSGVRITQIGTVGQVLRDGQTEARVRLSDVVEEPGAYAVGAAEGLQGEILVLNGVVWMSESDGCGGQVTREMPADECRATLLTVAHVRDWSAFRVDRAVQAAEFESFIEGAVSRAGLAPGAAVPFLIEGPLVDAELHIVNGRCPMQAAEHGSEREPYRASRARGTGILLGFYAPDAAGVLTHHGSSIHAHALLHGDKRCMGHVDSVGIGEGATLGLPTR